MTVTVACTRLIMPVAMHLALCSVSLVLRPMVLGIMAGMVQKDSCSGMCKAGISPQLQFLAGRRIPFVAAKTALHGPALSEDHREFSIAVHGDRCLHCASRAGSPFRRGSELLNMVADVPVVQVELFPGAVVKETAETAAAVEKSLAPGGSEGDFSGPCTQVQSRGSCPQGHRSHN